MPFVRHDSPNKKASTSPKTGGDSASRGFSPFSLRPSALLLSPSLGPPLLPLFSLPPVSSPPHPPSLPFLPPPLPSQTGYFALEIPQEDPGLRRRPRACLCPGSDLRMKQVITFPGVGSGGWGGGGSKLAGRTDGNRMRKTGSKELGERSRRLLKAFPCAATHA